MKSKTGMAFIALPCIDVKETVEMYERALGVEFKEEKHDDGPVHFAAELDNSVLELYDAKDLKRMVMGFDVPWDDNVRRVDTMNRELRIKGKRDETKNPG